MTLDVRSAPILPECVRRGSLGHPPLIGPPV